VVNLTVLGSLRWRKRWNRVASTNITNIWNHKNRKLPVIAYYLPLEETVNKGGNGHGREAYDI